jgi:hypothetical protein
VEPEKALQHYRTIHALPLILGASRRSDAEYLETCRRKRNVVEYDVAGAATAADADELLSFAAELRSDVLAWLRSEHPGMVP